MASMRAGTLLLPLRTMTLTEASSEPAGHSDRATQVQSSFLETGCGRHLSVSSYLQACLCGGILNPPQALRSLSVSHLVSPDQDYEERRRKINKY